MNWTSCLAIVAAWIVSAPPAGADTLHVPGDYPSILAAVDAAVSGDIVLVEPGTYTESDTRTVVVNGLNFTITALAFPRGGVTLTSSGGPGATVLDIGSLGNSSLAIFFGESDEEFVVEGFTFTGRTPQMDSSGCIVGVGAPSLRVVDCRFQDNHADLGDPQQIAGVSVGSCRLVLEDCEFVGNSTFGGLVNVSQSDAEIRRCEFRENVGVGISCHDDEQSVGNTEWLIEDCRFLDNTTARCVQLTGGPFVVRHCKYLRNSSSRAGAGIYAWPARSEGVIEFCTFVRDSSFVGGGGAGIWAREGDLEVRNNTFFENYSEFTGGACMTVSGGAVVEAEGNIFSHSAGTAAVRATSGTYLPTCNNYWENSGGDFRDAEAGPLDFSADPQFCDPENLDFTLRANSPCSPDLSPCESLIGAWDVSCGPVSIEKRSWSSLKALYR